MGEGACLMVVELEVSKDGGEGEEDEEGVQHDHTALHHQRVV